jgi:hypothetical protein
MQDTRSWAIAVGVHGIKVFAHPSHGVSGGRVPMAFDMQDAHISRILKDWYFATIEPGQNAGLIRVIVFWP